MNATEKVFNVLVRVTESGRVLEIYHNGSTFEESQQSVRAFEKFATRRPESLFHRLFGRTRQP